MGAHHGPSGTAELQLGIRYADSFPTTANAELELGDPRTGGPRGSENSQ